MALPTAFEQELLELMNRARANPAGEFDRLILDASTNTAVDGSVTSAINYFNVDLALFQSQLQGYGAVAPLAWSNPLNEAAYAHSYQMIIQDSQAHVLPGEMDIGDRIRAAGYDFSGFGSYGYGENIYAFAKSPIHAHADFILTGATAQVACRPRRATGTACSTATSPKSAFRRFLNPTAPHPSAPMW